MDKLVENEWRIIEEIIESDDKPTLMMNLNRYKKGNYPDGELYLKWKSINEEMIASVGGKILYNPRAYQAAFELGTES